MALPGGAVAALPQVTPPPPALHWVRDWEDEFGAWEELRPYVRYMLRRVVLSRAAPFVQAAEVDPARLRARVRSILGQQ